MNERSITFHSIEQVPPVAENTKPLTAEEKRRVEEATRFEREGDYVTVSNYRRFVSPVHKRRH